MEPDSPIFSLKMRRDEITEDLFLDLRVPRWNDPEVWVRYRPVDESFINKHADPQKRKKSHTTLADSNADLLVGACEYVYAVVDGKHYSLNPDKPTGEYTGFDADLRKNLGMVTGTARDIAKELFLTSLDLASHVRQLVEWSGATIAESNEEFSGE